MLPTGLNDDFIDFLELLIGGGVQFVLVGAHALAAHGVVRATGDMDILVRPNAENATRVTAALSAFGAPMAAHGVNTADFATPETVYQMGLPPRRIDVLTSISGLSFDEIWQTHITINVGELQVPVIGRLALIKNKESAAREKDLLDAKLLRAADTKIGAESGHSRPRR